MMGVRFQPITLSNGAKGYTLHRCDEHPGDDDCGHLHRGALPAALGRLRSAVEDRVSRIAALRKAR